MYLLINGSECIKSFPFQLDLIRTEIKIRLILIILLVLGYLGEGLQALLRLPVGLVKSKLVLMLRLVVRLVGGRLG